MVNGVVTCFTELHFIMTTTVLDRELNCEGERKGTCFSYDEIMLKHRNVFKPEHPENPGRISVAYERFNELGLSSRCCKVQSRIATDEELLLVHSEKYLEEIKEIDTLDDKELEAKGVPEGFDSIYFSKFTHECARMAVGCTLAVVDDVLSGNSRNGAAIVRPPGHHADHDLCMGYCYFNNVAIAAKHAQKKWNVERVLIVDWDIHHGNGIQHLFQSDPSVLYFSIHRYDNGNFWPHKKYSDFDFIGKEEGEGFNINIAWNKKHMNDADYVAAFQRILLPVAYEFSPDLVLISGGFDSARGDPKGICDVTPEGYAHLTHMLMSLADGKLVLALEKHMNDADYVAAFQRILLPVAYEFSPDLVLISGGFDSARGDPKGICDVTPEGYAHLTHMLMNLADGKLVLALEGGYNLTSVAESLCSCVATLLGDSCPKLEPLVPSESAMESIANTHKIHSQYWSCLKP